jgi:hypothetical protein
MYCPACRAEYQEGIRECADCQVALVRRLAETEGEPTVETVRVWVGQDSWQAELLRHALEESGIACFSDRNSGILPTGELGETGLWVRKEDEPQARTMLEELRVEIVERPFPAGEDDRDTGEAEPEERAR